MKVSDADKAIIKATRVRSIMDAMMKMMDCYNIETVEDDLINLCALAKDELEGVCDHIESAMTKGDLRTED